MNVDWFFLSHRLPIALEALRQGYEVHLVTQVTDKLVELERFGLVVHLLIFNRGSATFVDEFYTLIQLWKLFGFLKPDIIHLVTIKPILLGGLVARLTGQKAVVVAVSGLGLVFTSPGFFGGLRCWLVANIYKFIFRHPNLKVIFQNTDDRDRIVNLTHLPASKLELIHGSGVDLTEYVNTPLFEGIPIVIFAARFLGDKGIREFVRAAATLKRRGINARFCLVGSTDLANPNSITDQELADWSREGVVELWGQRRDMPVVLSLASLVVLPSYYGEGLPKVLIEASACGRAIITTNHPGCRDAIIPGVTGLLVAIKDPDDLADAMEHLLSNPAIYQSMGKEGRLFAESKFDVRYVVSEHLRIYLELNKAS